MKMICKRMLVALLAIALVLPLMACRLDEPNGESGGIQIEKDAPYSEEVLERAEQTIFSLVLYTYRSAVLDKMPEKVEKRLADYAHRICDITAAQPVSEEQYLWVLKCLKEQGEGAIDDIIAMRRGEPTDCKRARELYLDLSSVFGAEHTASMLYDCCVMVYDVRYERIIEKMESYQYPWYKEEAEALSAEKAVFTSSIGREDFSALVRFDTAVAELMSIDAGEIPDAFSDAEVLEIIRHLDISEIDIDRDGWKLLLSHIPSGNSSYGEELFEVFTKSGDIDRVADVMNDAMALTVGAMGALTAEDVGLLREGEQKEFIAAVFSRFEDADWERFEAVSAVSLSNGEYSALATEQYGEAYTNYLTDMRPLDPQALRARVGDPDFCVYLADYLAAICPAISYEVVE